VIAYTVGEGRPLVLIHGFGVDHRIMLPLEDALRTAIGWRRIYLDLPWAENAPASDAASAQDVADAIVAELQSTLGGEPFAVVGNSFGGMIARYVAHRMRDQLLGLATLAAAFAPIPQRILPPRQVVHVNETVLEAAGPARGEFEDMAVVQSLAALDAFSRYVLPGLQGAKQDVMDRISQNYAFKAEPEALDAPPLTVPTLHISGRQDHVTGYEDGLALRDHYPRASYAVLDAAGHNVHLEQPNITSALLLDWLTRMETTAR
jgi:pimeloyl-ACP methyl ester carboxylesterase